MRLPSALTCFPVLSVAVIALPLGATGFISARQLISADAWRDIFAWSGIAQSALLSLTSALAAALIALLLALTLYRAGLHGPRRAGRFSALLLSVPHIALATGLILLLAPSGWLLRAVSPWLTGFRQPPDWPLINDPWAIALTLVLILKETPFLLLMVHNQCAQINLTQQLQSANSLGYPSAQAWWRFIVPQLLPGLRLPLFCVLAFSLSAVDIGLLLGPQRPLTLATQVWQWALDPGQSPALAICGAGLLLVLTLFSFVLWRATEALWIRSLQLAGARRRRRDGISVQPLRLAGGFFTCGAYLALCAASFAQGWRFPALLPDAWTTDYWQSSFDELVLPAGNALLIAGVSNLLGLCLAIGLLEWQRSQRLRIPPLLLMLPLLLPQLNLVFGLQYLAALFDISGTLGCVIFAHLLFVLPYYFLSLSGSWRSLDPRLLQTALSLGKTPWYCFWHLTVPLVRKAVAIAVALGIAVSIGLYLPTLGPGAGRITTLATETVAYAGGIDTRLAAVAALWQTAIPLFFYLLALSLPPAVRRRKSAPT